MAGVTFSLKCSPSILTFMVKPIISLLYENNISLTNYIDNFTNQAKCDYNVIFLILVIALIFICCGWSINRVENFLEQTWALMHLGFLWDCGLA